MKGMKKETWEAPSDTIEIIVFAYVPVLVWAIILPLIKFPIRLTWMPFSIAFLIISPIIVLIVYYTNREIWNSPRRRLEAEAETIIWPILEALRDNGFEPAHRKRKYRYSLSPNRESIDLKDGIIFTISRLSPKGCMIYVSPDNERSHSAVERAKQVIDQAYARQGL